MPTRFDRLSMRALIVVAVLAASSHPALGQWIGKQTGCYADSIVANPNRPTVANPADITQYGVLELEYGWDRVWPEGNSHQTSFGGLLKFGLLCDVELRWNTTSYVWQTGSGGRVSGLGDNWIGPQVRIYKQTRRVPTIAFGYQVKVPSADSRMGLGSGQVDHALTLLASKDIADFHFDFNATHFWIGQAGAPEFGQNSQINLAFSHRVRGNLQFTGEFYGDTQLDSSTPGFASSLWALTYTITPRLVIDSGFETGITSGGPHRHAFFGATYSIGNLYPGWRRKKTTDPAK